MPQQPFRLAKRSKPAWVTYNLPSMTEVFRLLNNVNAWERELSSPFSCKIQQWTAIISLVAKKVFLGFRLSPDLRKQLEEIAAHEERSLSQICELLLRKGVE